MLKTHNIETLQLRFFENSSDSHNLAFIALNNTKLNIRHTYYKARYSYSLCANSSLRGAERFSIDFDYNIFSISQFSIRVSMNSNRKKVIFMLFALL